MPSCFSPWVVWSSWKLIIHHPSNLLIPILFHTNNSHFYLRNSLFPFVSSIPGSHPRLQLQTQKQNTPLPHVQYWLKRWQQVTNSGLLKAHSKFVTHLLITRKRMSMICNGQGNSILLYIHLSLLFNVLYVEFESLCPLLECKSLVHLGGYRKTPQAGQFIDNYNTISLSLDTKKSQMKALPGVNFIHCSFCLILT